MYDFSPEAVTVVWVIQFVFGEEVLIQHSSSKYLSYLVRRIVSNLTTCFFYDNRIQIPAMQQGKNM